ncbi:hypothetical protein I4U23_027210 [Adineta vaga]|nr:hypothetical protein I4U23_027210 [Adineta vaga]
MAQRKWGRNFQSSGGNIHCSFENVLTRDAAMTIGNNIQRILGIRYFNTEEMASEVPSPYKFNCSRRDANRMRDELWKITTDIYAFVWFSIQDNSLDSIYDSASQRVENSNKVKEYSMFCYFGSMYSYDTFVTHSERYPTAQDLYIIKLKKEPDTIRIVSRNKSKQMFIPIKWLKNEILVKTKKQPCVVLMLKHSVIIKRAISTSGPYSYERSCETIDSEFERIVSKSSDILLSFFDVQHTWAFLEELTRSSNGRRNKFNIKFVTLQQEFAENDEKLFDLPSSTSTKKQYAFHILDSMGYVFQDKYSKELHERFIASDDESFNQMCYFFKDRLEENHCYDMHCDLKNYIKRNCEEKQSSETKVYSVGSVVVTPLRLLFQKRETTAGNRALRILQTNDEDMFLLVRIREEDGEELKNFDSSVRCRIKSKMLHGLKVLGRTYRFVGASNSQLREMSFWFIATYHQSVEDIWKIFGNFSTIQNVATYIARIGLYFTKSIETQMIFRFEKDFSSDMSYVVTMIDDIETDDKKYCFTDGIGKMSWGVAGLVAIKLNLKLNYKDDIPAAYQVRIAGCKGMLAIDPESTLDEYYIKIRPSMKKFDSDNWQLEICEYSQPLALKLNNQVIMLLSDLGNSNSVFQSYQYAALSSYSSTRNENEDRRKLQYAKNEKDLLKNKIPLPSHEARNMFGVVDETGTLEYGEVFIQYKSLDSLIDNVYIIVTGEVLVAKMPCLYPGDFRKLTAVNVPKLQSCMRDCIVFPSKGFRSHPSEMSGSDLDGDKYWVYWGKELKIHKMDEPLSYEPAEKKIVEEITNEIVVDHIVQSFGTGAQGIICDVHLAIATKLPEHTRSLECKRLAELFARAVDAPKTGENIVLDEVYELKTRYCQQYPLFMMKYDQESCDSNSILNDLFEKALKHLNAPHENLPRRPINANSQIQLKRRSEKDENFKKWLAEHDYHQKDTSGSSADSGPNLPPGVGETVAGGCGEGDRLNQLINPEGILIDDDDETIFLYA